MTFREWLGGAADMVTPNDLRRQGARFILDLPETATDEKIEAARVKRARVWAEREEAETLLDERTKERDEARAELAELKSAPGPTREELAQAMWDATPTSYPWERIPRDGREVWLAAADGALRMIRPGASADLTQALKDHKEAHQLCEAMIKARDVALDEVERLKRELHVATEDASKSGDRPAPTAEAIELFMWRNGWPDEFACAYDEITRFAAALAAHLRGAP